MEKMNFFDSTEIGSHVFVIYNSKELELSDLHSILNNGLDQNILVILFLKNHSKHGIYNEANTRTYFTNYKGLKTKNNIIIKQTDEWFNPDECSNFEKFIKKWETLVDTAISNGYKGIRIVVETNRFLREILDNGFIAYDKILEELFDFPITTIYVYKNKDVETMTLQQTAMLKSNRGYYLQELTV